MHEMGQYNLTVAQVYFRLLYLPTQYLSLTLTLALMKALLLPPDKRNHRWRHTLHPHQGEPQTQS